MSDEMIRKRIDINKFIKNFNIAHKKNYILPYYWVCRNTDNKIELAIPVPIDGNEKNTDKYDIVFFDDLEKIINSIKTITGGKNE